jgi:hypothetical protein
LAIVHLRMILLKHGLLRAKMRHGHAIMHRTRRGSPSTRRHTSHHRTLSDLRRRHPWMHGLHHTRPRLTSNVTSAGMLHAHGMTRRHSRMARSDTPMMGKRLGHHLRWR